jgi:hypothetical protein
LGKFVATTGQKPWPSVGTFVAAHGQVSWPSSPARWISGLYMFVAADGLALKVC